MTIAAVCTMSAQKFTGKIGEFEVTLYADFSNASKGDYAGSSLFLPAAGCFKKEGNVYFVTMGKACVQSLQNNSPSGVA